MDRIIIAGGSGFLGRSLTRYLVSKGYDVTILSRFRPTLDVPFDFSEWNGRTLGNWTKQFENALAVVNLAGRTVDCVKTPDHCDEILRSRIDSTRAIGNAIREATNPPKIWIQMATAHRYGDSPDVVCDENAAFGYGLAPFVGQEWERAHTESLTPGIRSFILRTSFVLGRTGGALPRLAGLARFGLGGTVGSGKQGISWIHERDMNRIIHSAITEERYSGPVIATAPNPVSNAEFMSNLRKAMKMPIGLPAFGWMVKLGAQIVLKTDPELALYGRYCVSRRLPELGFQFEFPELPLALKDLYP
jgi:uncharacterized protein